MSRTIFVLNGPNLNLLGQRQPHIYGYDTLETVASNCTRVAAPGYVIRLEQSNHEGQIIDWIHEAREAAAGIVINPAAYTHTSVAILDALNACDCPVLEVHISNVHRRETWRHTMVISPYVTGTILGLGLGGYDLALAHVASTLPA